MEILSLFIDISIVVLLIWTIMVAGRLVKNLTAFNNAKKELGVLITQVSSSVTQADQALKNFKKSVNESGKDLAGKVSEAKMLSDELELICKSSNSVADRLEKLVEITPKAKSVLRKPTAVKAPAVKKKGIDWVKNKIDKANKANKDASEDGGMFAIRDPEFEQGLKESAEIVDVSDDAWDGPAEIESEAERALYNALKTRRN